MYAVLLDFAYSLLSPCGTNKPFLHNKFPTGMQRGTYVGSLFILNHFILTGGNFS